MPCSFASVRTIGVTQEAKTRGMILTLQRARQESFRGCCSRGCFGVFAAPESLLHRSLCCTGAIADHHDGGADLDGVILLHEDRLDDALER